MAKKIMVVFDDHQLADAAIDYAAELAAYLSAEISILGILSTGDVAENTEFVDPVLWSVIRSEFEAVVNGFADRLAAKNIYAAIQIIKSPQIEELCCQSSGMGCHFIVVQVDSAHPSLHVQTILKHATVPVLLVRTNTQAHGVKNILVPLDGSQRAETPLNLAASIVKAGNGRLHLVHIVEKSNQLAFASLSKHDLAMEEQIIDRRVYEANRYLKQIAGRLGVETTNHVLVENKITLSLHHLIAQESIDMLIVCAHGHSGEARWPSGTIAENLIRYAEIPTIVVQDLPAEIAQPHIEPVRAQNGAG
jgi:nucleotide-binding universal stress UspA family protein